MPSCDAASNFCQALLLGLGGGGGRPIKGNNGNYNNGNNGNYGSSGNSYFNGKVGWCRLTVIKPRVLKVLQGADLNPPHTCVSDPFDFSLSL